MNSRRTLLCLFTLMLCMQIARPWMKFNSYTFSRRDDLKEKCPEVKAMINFQLKPLLGMWYVVQYYASTMEIPEYACMQSRFTFSEDDQHITMNFSYIFAEDPVRERQFGNITWHIPDFNGLSHWMHTENIYEGVYNTYVLDTDYTNWGLLMHCAEKEKHPRYLSALLLAREKTLSDNVISYLREKLTRYDIDLSFLFPINQASCDSSDSTTKEEFYT